MATHSSVLAWRIPGTGEPGGLPSLGSHGVGHDWSDAAAAAAVLREKAKLVLITFSGSLPTPVFLPRESHGRRSLVGYSPWGRKESDTTERLHFHFLVIPQPDRYTRLKGVFSFPFPKGHLGEMLNHLHILLKYLPQSKIGFSKLYEFIRVTTTIIRIQQSPINP